MVAGLSPKGSRTVEPLTPRAPCPPSVPPCEASVVWSRSSEPAPVGAELVGAELTAPDDPDESVSSVASTDSLFATPFGVKPTAAEPCPAPARASEMLGAGRPSTAAGASMPVLTSASTRTSLARPHSLPVRARALEFSHDHESRCT
ncbi:Uncharacterised protein [Mycobacteroides abscessus subsp. abscessus]|nr:Uncharacterised protein [Mycobacteroides abscessus subsp. abscessus]